MHYTLHELLNEKIEHSVFSFYKKDDFQRIQDEEEKDEYRLPFWRDCQRLISSPSFRRLKGKTQLFPGNESDFFRCRLTHSLEVAHIGKTIAKRLNIILKKKLKVKQEEEEKEGRVFTIHPYYSFIDIDLVEFACLAHDLGHPPFGHQGEDELNELMKNHGGFEGNAQTLRLLTCIEKKRYTNNIDNLTGVGFSIDGNDSRLGINPTLRSITSVLKYDFEIPQNVNKKEKGYYNSETKKVNEAKKRTLKGKLNAEEAYKCIECQIMDLADDIAYSVYDLEDAFKGNFIQPLDFKIVGEKVLQRVSDKINTKHFENSDLWDVNDVSLILEMIFDSLYQTYIREDSEDFELNDSGQYEVSNLVASNGYYRADFTSALISSFIKDIDININFEEPSQSEVTFKKYKLEEDGVLYFDRMYKGINKSFLYIEVLKHFNYEFQIDSPKLRIIEYRGREIVKTIFESLVEYDGKFLPGDVREMYKIVSESEIYSIAEKESKKMRIICDFVASMTDHYALEFYSRLKSESPKSIYKPMH